MIAPFLCATRLGGSFHPRLIARQAGIANVDSAMPIRTNRLLPRVLLLDVAGARIEIASSVIQT